MKNIDKINNKLKYTEFYSLPKKTWNDWSFYMLLDDQLVNNYNFLNTFKDKINFSLLYTTKNVKLKFIKYFMDKYGVNEWHIIFSKQKQNITPQFLNKYYKKIIVPIPLDLIKKFHEQGKLKQEVVDYAIHHQYSSIIKAKFISDYV